MAQLSRSIHMETSYNSSSTQPLFRASQIIWYGLMLVEVILGFRLFLKLFGANPFADFTNIIYSISMPLVVPFMAVFPSTKVSGSVFEWTTVLAMVVYWVIAVGIIRFLVMSRTISTPEAASKLEQL